MTPNSKNPLFVVHEITKNLDGVTTPRGPNLSYPTEADFLAAHPGIIKSTSAMGAPIYIWTDPATNDRKSFAT